MEDAILDAVALAAREHGLTEVDAAEHQDKADQAGMSQNGQFTIHKVYTGDDLYLHVEENVAPLDSADLASPKAMFPPVVLVVRGGIRVSVPSTDPEFAKLLDEVLTEIKTH